TAGNGCCRAPKPRYRASIYVGFVLCTPTICRVRLVHADQLEPELRSDLGERRCVSIGTTNGIAPSERLRLRASGGGLRACGRLDRRRSEMRTSDRHAVGSQPALHESLRYRCMHPVLLIVCRRFSTYQPSRRSSVSGERG